MIQVLADNQNFKCSVEYGSSGIYLQKEALSLGFQPPEILHRENEMEQEKGDSERHIPAYETAAYHVFWRLWDGQDCSEGASPGPTCEGSSSSGDRLGN